MTEAPAVRIAVDLGGATTAAALLARLDGRWRLLGSLALPAAVPLDAVIATLANRLAVADSDLASLLGVPEAVPSWPRLVARTGAPPRLAVLTATERALERHVAAARRAGWSVVGASAQSSDPLAMTRLVLRHDIRAVLVGAGEPPGADERPVLGELASLVAAAAERRGDITVVLAGAMALEASRFEGGSDGAAGDAVEGEGGRRAPATTAAGATGPEANASDGAETEAPGSGRTADADGRTQVPDTARGDAGPTSGAADGGDAAADAGDRAGGSIAAEGAVGVLPHVVPTRVVDEDVPAPGVETVPDVPALRPAISAEPGSSMGTSAEAQHAPADGQRRDGRARSMSSLVLAPAVDAGDPPGEPLRTLLDELRASPDDGRRGAVRSVAALAGLLDRRIELIEIGHDAGLRATASPLGGTGRVGVRWITLAAAAFVPDPVDDEAVDRVLRWCTLPLDRYRLRDRLGELRLAPWSEPHGDGAPLRLSAARAAVERLAQASPDLDRPVPDLTIVAGGVWAVAPGPAVALAIADVLRRPGAIQLAADRARLLGPLGVEPDETTRRSLVADLADDLMTPLGSVVITGGLRAGRSAGRLVVHAEAGATELDLVPGGLELVDLPPGESARAEFRFRESVTLGTRGRHFAVDVGGGLGGLLVDLRDVPLHLPDRADRRRELLAAWQRALWTGLDR